VDGFDRRDDRLAVDDIGRMDDIAAFGVVLLRQALVEGPPRRDGLAAWATLEGFCLGDLKRLSRSSRVRAGLVAREDRERSGLSRRRRVEGEADLSRIQESVAAMQRLA
jgi:hypothetical protein